MRNRYSFIKIISFFFFYGTVFCLASHVSAAVKIVAFGNSITTGYPFLIDEEGDLVQEGGGCQCPEQGYERQLEELMDSAGYRSVVVKNYGFSAEKTPEGLLRIDDVLSNENPDYVLLLEGTNDLLNSGPSTPGRVRDNLSEMIEKVLLNSEATPILANLTPDTTVAGLTKDIAETNDLIKGLWEEKVQEGKKVLFVDLYAAFVDRWEEDELTDDRLHPNEAGYGVMAETWGATLQQELPRPFYWPLFIPAIISKTK